MLKEVYYKIAKRLILSFFVVLLIYSFVNLDFFKDLSLNLLGEILGIAFTVYVVDLLFKEFYENENAKLKEKHNKLLKLEALNKDKQTMHRYISEVITLLDLCIEKMNTGQEPDIGDLRLKLSNPPICYSFNEKELSEKSIEALEENMHLLFKLEADLKRGEFTSKTLVDYKISLLNNSFNILQIKYKSE